MVSEEDLLLQRQRLKEQHRNLELQIQTLLQAPVIDQMRIQRLKKEKLSLKDQISYLESELFPDIIA